MKKKSRASIILLSVFLLLSAAGCGQQVESPSVEQSSTSVEGSASQEDPEKPKEEVNLQDSFSLVSQMTIGWNLGNTFDAHGMKGGTKDETYWGNPTTTAEMIKAVNNQGFNTIRIPVTWYDHIGKAPDYTIDQEWIDRVAEVVNYAFDQNMFVILDTHHETDKWLIPSQEKEEVVTEELVAIWKQIATYFKDYDEHLIFEGLNEPRTKGSANEWSGGTRAERVVVNHLNAAFVDAVRSVGGKNETRMLILATYGNSVTSNTINELVLPEDEHLALAVHLYTPYFFTYTPDSGNISEWTGVMKSDIESNFKMVKTYQAMYKIPVIVTEFGAEHEVYKDTQGNSVENGQQVILWLEDYLSIAGQYNIKCVWWDNGIYDKSGEKFAIFDRRNLSWFDQNIADKLVELAKTKYNQNDK